MAVETEKYKKRLIEERDRLNRELTGSTASTIADLDERQVTAADAGFIATGVDVEAEIKDKKTHRLDQVSAALQAIEDGTYGTCGKCNKAIDPNRLDADPAALTCLEDQLSQEANFEAPTL